MSESKWLTAQEAGAHVRMSPETVRRHAVRGEVRGSFTAGRWLFRVADLDAWLDSRANQAAPKPSFTGLTPLSRARMKSKLQRL